MLSKIIRSKALIALAIPVLALSFTFADCDKGDQTVAAGKGSHCRLLAKQVTKSYEFTDDGAVVTLTGKTEKAVSHIQDHFALHEKGEECDGCPLSQEGVAAQFEITEDGGIVRVQATTPETVESVQKWAKAPAGQCCGGDTDKV